MIDLTLDEILIPDITGYINPYDFGTKIQYTETNKGGLSTREVNHNILAPFDKMRGVKVEQTDYTSEVQYDAKLFINASDVIDLTLGNAQYAGCKVTIVNPTAFTHNLLCTSVSESNGKLLPNSEAEVIWNGTAWQNFSAPAKGKMIIQYPQEKAPVLIYPCTSWDEVNYTGAFFRHYKNGISDNFSEKNQSLKKQYNATAKNGLNISFLESTTSETDPKWTVDSYVAPHAHTYSITGNDYYDHGQGVYDTKCSIVDHVWDVGYTRFDLNENILNFNAGLYGNHTHNINLLGSLTSNDIETRPDNYTIKIWKRIA